MARVSIPKNISETKETLEKISNRIKMDAKDSTICSILTQLGFDVKLEKLLPHWTALDNQYNELIENARLIKVQKDTIMNDELRPLVMEIKNIVTFSNAKNPILNNSWGFPTIINPTKKAPTEKSVENDLKRVAAKANLVNESKAMTKAMKDAKATAQQSSAKASLTINEVTKTFV
jgi:hypothetical protein